jgi:hypothetical protein
VLVEATHDEGDAILRAMRDVATAAGTLPLTDADRAALIGARHYVFRRLDEIDVESLPPIQPAELAAHVTNPQLRSHAVAFSAVMTTVDGQVDPAKIAVVLGQAGALGVDDDEVRQLAEAAQGHLQWVLADMTRQNMRSITHHEFRGDVNQWLVPYGDAPDPALAARYRRLADLATGTFGRAFHDFYAENGFAFAGEAGALNETFATPHDATHVLSGYSTTPQGELLVSTFTAGMHPDEPVSGHILPVIFSWHIGVQINAVAGRVTGALQPEKFWVAWTRGSALAADTFDPAWDLWSVAAEPLDRLRERYEVPPLDPAMAADDDPPPWYHPTA